MRHQLRVGSIPSSIAVIAADMLATTGKKLNTFTAVPEATFRREETRSFYFNERPYVQRIADANSNLVPHFIPPSGGPMLEQIAQQIRVAGAPTGGVLNGLWTMDIVAAARSAGHDVMLLGEIGNNTMSYDGWPLFAELLSQGATCAANSGDDVIRPSLETYDSSPHDSTIYSWLHFSTVQAVAPWVVATLARFCRYTSGIRRAKRHN